MPAAPVAQKAPADAPKSAKVKSREAVHTYPVKHDHWLGSCKGVMRITPNAISFVSESRKHSFDLRYSQFSYALDDDQLTIKAGSRTYNLKSAIAFTKDENRTHLLNIFQDISRFHPIPPLQKQQGSP